MIDIVLLGPVEHRVRRCYGKLGLGLTTLLHSKLCGLEPNMYASHTYIYVQTIQVAIMAQGDSIT